jgi:hypothetical protein
LNNISKFTIITLAAVLVISSLTVSVFGNSSLKPEVDYDPNDGIVTVTGNAGSEYNGKKATLIVLNPDDEAEYTLEDITEQNAEELIFIVLQTVVEDGQFVFRYNWNENLAGGEYIYKVAVEDLIIDEAERSISKYFASISQINEAIGHINAAKTKEEMALHLENPLLSLATSSEFYASNRLLIAKKLMDLKGDIQFENISAVSAMFNDAYFYCLADEGRMTKEALEAYFERKSINLPEEYSSYPDSVIDKININKTKNLLSDDELIRFVANQTTVVAINKSGREELISVLQAYDDILGLSQLSEYSVYDKLSHDDKILFNIDLTNKDFNTIQEFLEAFKKRTKTFNPSGNIPGPGGETGGKGTASSSYKAAYIDNSDIEKAEDRYKITFSDLSDVQWAKEAIEDFADKGYISGTSEKEFSPNAEIKREEFVKIIVNVFDLADEEAECDFSDCDKSMWYYSYVAAANKLGIVNGISEQEFGIGAPITRQDLCVIAHRIMQIKNIRAELDDSIEFEDADEISEYALDSVRTLSAANIINGKGNNIFDPQSSCTRAEAVIIIYRLLQHL